MDVPAADLDRLDTERLLLRPRRAEEAAAYHQLWIERDPRVPPHRQISPDGRPSVQDIADQIRGEAPEPGLLAVVRKQEGDVIGYCGFVFHGTGAPDEPELAFELQRATHGHGYATEAGRAVVAWAADAGYPRMWASVWEWNTASRRVLDKLGFREVSRTGGGQHGDNLTTVLAL